MDLDPTVALARPAASGSGGWASNNAGVGEALVWAPAGAPDYLHRRTVRSLRRLGFTVADEAHSDEGSMRTRLEAASGPILVVEAGAWFRRLDPLILPPPGGNSGGFCGLGAVVDREDSRPGDSASWRVALASTGGDFTAPGTVPWAAVRVAWLDAVAARALAGSWKTGEVLGRQLAQAAGVGGWRLVHLPALDVGFDSRWRIVQLVTSLQRGGAERIALNLASGLGALDVVCSLAFLGRPQRGTFELPAGVVDLSATRGDRDARATAVERLLHRFGADILHSHLVDREDAGRFGRAGVPQLMTIHNTRAAWPAGLGGLRGGDVALLAACSKAVETEIVADGLPVVTRTVWNGIELPVAPPGARRELRRQWGIGEAEIVLLALANPRPQKRLERLPGILAAMSATGCRPARLILAGEAANNNETASSCVAAVDTAARELGVEGRVHWVGPMADVAAVLAASDVLISTSAHEGLSLAQLEALAAGVPVVTTAVGGAAEVVRELELLARPPGNLPCRLVDVEAGPAEFVREIVAVLADRNDAGPEREAAQLPAALRSATMVARYRWLYPRIAAMCHRRTRRGVWLVTNNFSTGGAQSSARRLLLAWQAAGIPVRAAVLEEAADNPTPGTRALRAAGVLVFAAPVIGEVPPEVSLATLFAAVDADPPVVVLCWNVMPVAKMLLVDGLLDVPMFDVSPGEMYFTSLARYFARPHPLVPIRTADEYGARLAGVVVKYEAEAARARELLRAPVHVVPNGVPLTASSPCGVRGDGHLVLGTAARLHPQKRIEDLLSAVRLASPHLPPWILKIAGGVDRDTDDYVEALREQARGLPVEWVEEVADTREFLAGLDVFVMISEPAGCPNASLEAMAAGLAVIATDVGGVAEQVIDGLSGLLVSPRDDAALSRAIVRVANDPDLRMRLAAGAFAHVQERFSLERMAAAYAQICFDAAGACAGTQNPELAP